MRSVSISCFLMHHSKEEFYSLEVFNWFIFGFFSFLPLVFHPLPLPSHFSLSPPFLLPIPFLDRLSFHLTHHPAGRHLIPLPGGSLLSLTSPACPPSQAAWIDRSLSVNEDLKLHRLPIYGHSTSHDRRLFIPFIMLLPCIVSLHSNFLELSHGSPGSVNFLLNVVAGVGGGRLLGIPWQELPLIRAFVKE